MAKIRVILKVYKYFFIVRYGGHEGSNNYYCSLRSTNGHRFKLTDVGGESDVAKQPFISICA